METIREGCLGRKRRLAVEFARSVRRDKIDNVLHTEDQRAACDYCLVQSGYGLNKIPQSSDIRAVRTFDGLQMCVLCTCILVFMNTAVPVEIIKLHS